jgi:thimet oligopeptidase
MKTFNWSLTADEIKDRACSLIKESRKVYDECIQQIEPTFEKTIMSLLIYKRDESFQINNLTFLKYVSPHKDIREASRKASEMINEFSIEMAMRYDMYTMFKTVHSLEKKLGVQQQRLMDKIMESYERQGFNLPEQQRKKIKSIMNEQVKLSSEFMKNLADDSTTQYFTLKDLDGCTPDFINRLKKDEDRYQVNAKIPHMRHILRNAKNPETRRKSISLYYSACQMENVPIMETLIYNRAKKAVLLGYDTCAEYITAVKMVKTPDCANEFLNNLWEKLKNPARAELRLMQEFKRKETKCNELPDILSHDFQYYDQMIKKTMYDIDPEEVKQYFPIEKVIEILFSTFSHLFGMRIIEISNHDVWHTSVRYFMVYDADRLIGDFYMDLYSRDGKITGASAHTLIRTYKNENGSFQPSCTAIVCNFLQGADDISTLLLHSDITTLFHEFGHMLHNICSRSEFERFAGTSVERDFVECPSQLLENWAWQPIVLKQMSIHVTTGKQISDDIIKKIIETKQCNVSLLTLRQLFFGIFDMTVHSCKKNQVLDTDQLWHKLRKEITLIPSPDGINGISNFRHLAGGYVAGYYGYMYSKVFACDMFSEFEKKGIDSKEVGRRYRRTILERGSTQDGDKLLRDFLQREPDNGAFLKNIGINK